LIELHKGLMNRSKGSYENTNVQNEDVFRLVVENINDYAVILTDADGQITSWNAGIRNLFGYSESEFVGQPLSIIFTPEEMLAGVSKKQSAQTITENNHWIRRKDGSRFWAYFKVIPLKNTDESLRGLTYLLRDETSRKLTEENLERVLSGITDSFFRFDCDFRYIYVNRATTEMFGLSEADFLGKTLWELFPDADENIFHSEVQRALKEQETIVFENYYEPLDRWFENRVYPSPDDLSVFVTEITERKKIETALQQSEEKYRTLFDSIDSGFCVIELMFGDDGKAYNYTYLEINPSFEKQSGLRNAVGKTIRDFAPDHEEFWFETYTHVSLTGESVRFEHYSSGLDNWFEVYAFRLGETQTNRVAIVFNNITPRKLAEEKVIQLNERSRNILESINDAFFALDADWNFTYLNQQAEVLLKRTREDLLGKNIWEEFTAAVGTTFDEQYHKAFDEQTTVTFEEFYAPLETWFEVRAYPSATGLSVYFHNIDERKKAEKSLIEAEARYRALIEATSTTVWHATAEGALSFVGEKWTEVSGQTVEEILKWGWLEAIHPDDRERTIEIWQTALRNKTLYETEFRVLTVNGDYLWFAVSAVPIFDSDGNVREWVGLNTDITERKNSEALLRESEQQFSTLADVVPQLVWMAEADGFIFWYNRNWYEYTGTTPEDMEGWGWQSVHDPEILPKVLEGWKGSIERGEMFEMEFPLKRADGKFRWFLTRVNPFRDADGKIIRWFGTNTDIDVQRRLDARNRFIITVDEAVRPLETPQEITLTLARMLGEYLGVDRCAYAEVEEDEDHFTIPGDYTRGDTISIVGDYSMADFGAEVLRLMRENRPYIVNDVNTDPQVTKAVLEAYRQTTIEAVICVPLHKNGRFNACMAVHQRVPREWTAEEVELVQFFANRFWESIERARTNNNLRESEARFRNMADNAPMMVWVTEADGICTYLSQSWYEFTGQTPETGLGFGWIDATHPDDQQLAHDTFVTANEKREVFRIEYRLRRKDGSYAWAIDSAQPRFAENGEFMGYVGSVFDITERKNAEKEREKLLEGEQQARLVAEQANRLKDEFLATLSHELRTPLNAILGWSQMIQSRDLTESQMQKAFQTIERSARAQNQLIDDLLDVSRIITGKLRLDVRAVELSNVITAAVDAVRPAAEAKNIRLQTLLDPQAGPISGDPDRLQQVVWNLLSNAVKFTPKEGRVQVRLERVNSHVEIVISDTGKGIEADFLPYVFDRFRQSDGSMTRRHGGLGLGLAIVRQLVELHGGTVTVNSAGENQGSTFTVFLPLLPVRSEPANDPLRVHPTARNNDAKILEDSSQELLGLCILLVEDEADSRDLLNVVLTSSGAKVETANSAAEALKKIKREKFDIVVSDIGMPEEDGFSLIGKVRNLPEEQNGNVPAIALTAYARAEDRIRALRCGFQLHIAKPVEPIELIAAVANLTGRIRNVNN
jgi:PAS domain S-box-containing protein